MTRAASTMVIPLLIDQADGGDDSNNGVTNNDSNNNNKIDTVRTKDPRISLTKPLAALFALNGVALALPSTALLYIVNTRAAIPLEYLSVYGALAFLPFSLKPIYAFLSNVISRYGSSSSLGRRDWWLAVLLILNGLSTIGTAFVPLHGVRACMILGFLRGVTSAWPEFLLGLTLIDQARDYAFRKRTTTRYGGDVVTTNEDEEDDITSVAPSSHAAEFEKTTALFQSQAATARNIGSLFANLVALFLFLERSLQKNRDNTDGSKDDDNELSDAVVNGLLVWAGLFTFAGAFLAWYFSIGRQDEGFLVGSDNCDGIHLSTGGPSSNLHYDPLASIPTEFSASTLDTDEMQSETPSSSPTELSETATLRQRRTLRDGVSQARGTGYFSGDVGAWNVALVILLQVLILLFGLRGPIGQMTPSLPSLWKHVTIFIATIFVVVLIRTCPGWTRRHRVGVFLLVKHAVPSSTYLVQSYVYSLLQSTPLFIQLLGLFNMGMITFSSWSYGKVLAKYSCGWQFLVVLGGTIVVSSLMKLLDCVLVLWTSFSASVSSSTTTSWQTFLIVAAFQLVPTFVGEWQFLPSVILATNSISTVDDLRSSAASSEPPTQGRESGRYRSALTTPYEYDVDEEHNENGKPESDEEQEEEVGLESYHDEPSVSLGGRKRRACTGSSCCSCGGYSSCCSCPFSTRTSGAMDENNIEMQYGTLISCIDFGGQIGSWLLVPLVSAVHLNRDDGWQNLSTLILYTSLLNLIPLPLLAMLRSGGKL